MWPALSTIHLAIGRPLPSAPGGIARRVAPDGFWKRTPRSSTRDGLGRTVTTVEESSRRELVLGTRGRSGDQWDIWQAVYSPVGPDGYPASIWDKRTGVIDHSVAEYWKQHHDLMDILRRSWERGLGDKLRGKLHIYVGTMDTYFLDGSVRLAAEFLDATKNRPTRARSCSATASSTAGTATPTSPTRSRVCAITRCSSPGSSSASRHGPDRRRPHQLALLKQRRMGW